MNLTEALSELKITKGRIARLIEYRKKTLKLQKDEKVDKSFDELTLEITKLSEKANELKLKIIQANVSSGIQKLVLDQGGVRSELASMKALVKSGGKYSSDSIFDSYTKAEDVFQKTRFQLEDYIQSLERQKRTLDAQIQQLNWKTEV